eukprot:gene34598-41894_t
MLRLVLGNLRLSKAVGGKSLSKRRFSDQTKKADDEHEKAGEVGKLMWKFMKKYGLIAVPLSVFTVVTVDIINIAHHREWIEEHIPSYVGFVRKYYGFDDEDLQEKQRLQLIKDFHQSNVRIVVNVNGSEEVIEAKASSPLSSALQAFVDNHPAAQSSLYTSNMVTFEDDEVQSSNDVSEPSAPTVSPPSSFLDSLWSPELPQLEFNETSPQEVDAAFVIKQYCNVWHKLFGGLRKYHQHSLVGIRAVQNICASSAPRVSRENDGALQKQLALEQVLQLEQHIKNLHGEKLAGREIDEVDREIARMQMKIAEIKRKHLNFFYFF